MLYDEWIKFIKTMDFKLFKESKEYHPVVLDESFDTYIVYNKDPRSVLEYNEEVGACLQFAVFSQGEILLSGYGYGQSLRECRHTYWGENGYIFYPNIKTITLVLKELNKYFDMD